MDQEDGHKKTNSCWNKNTLKWIEWFDLLNQEQFSASYWLSHDLHYHRTDEDAEGEELFLSDPVTTDTVRS